MTDSITNVAAHLSSLLLSKEKELEDREANFNRRVQLFERENPSMGNDTDVLQLNVGGSTKIAVLRRTLTQFEDSMLAAKFSGRWDDSLEKDREGNFFVDQDPELFLRLVNYLRVRGNRSKVVCMKEPKPTYEFCSMLEYYGLMPGVYHQHWIGNNNDFSCEEGSYGTLVLSTKSADIGATVLHDFGLFSGISEFTLSFDKGTDGFAGWIDCNRHTALNWNQDKESKQEMIENMAKNSISFSNMTKKIMGPGGKVLKENLGIDYSTSSIEITCRCGENGEYSIEVLGVTPPVAATLDTTRTIGVGYYCKLFPMITFSGKVTVSGLKYAIDKLQHQL